MAPLRARAKQLLDYGKLKELHWDAKSGAFLDWGAHTEDVKVQMQRVQPQTNPVCTRLLAVPGEPIAHGCYTF